MKGRQQQQMWTAMRQLGAFTVAEIASLYAPGSPQFNAAVTTIETGCIAKVRAVIQAGQATACCSNPGRSWAARSPTAPATSRLSNLKELRPGSAGRSEIRTLYIFDPPAEHVLPVAGDKAGQREAWYRQAIPLAEQRDEDNLKQEDIR